MVQNRSNMRHLIQKFQAACESQIVIQNCSIRRHVIQNHQEACDELVESLEEIDEELDKVCKEHEHQ